MIILHSFFLSPVSDVEHVG